MRKVVGKAWAAVGYVPVVVLAVFGVSWAFQGLGLGQSDVFVSDAVHKSPL